ncbi:hypothetical protein BCON_0279g00150 [Botryotinia convoluta]|uniref:Uncharacterized protein n=1 Tax=Botryotinia convoluta TaxID=54673 RepID=A0A4Z1HE92_9HELO|nr:hypothetical protein BCON_0279g00150 [Botryotinia convoluta]
MLDSTESVGGGLMNCIHWNVVNQFKLSGENDALLDAIRKFRVQSSSPRKALEYAENKWNDSMWDSDSFNIFEYLRADLLTWSTREVKELSQFDDLQGRDRELFFGEAAKVVLLDGSDKREFPKGLQGRPRTLLRVLDALLTHHLYATVYTDPFFFLGEETSQILNDIMSLGNIWNLGHAQRWRGDTLRLIHPLYNTPDETMVKSETNKLLRNAAISGATKFMQSPAKYIMNNTPDALQRLEGLPDELDGDEEDFTPMALSPPPELLKDLKPATFPLRSDLSAEGLGERMLKRVDRVTLLDLVKPYLDDFAEQLRPVIEGLRGEIAQRIEERNEMEKQRDEFRSKYREALQSIERLKSGM